MSFQKTINSEIPRGVKGDFASTNPRASMLAGEGALVAAEAVKVGEFAFADIETGKVYQANVAGRRVGFVHRNNQALLGVTDSATMLIQEGRETALFTMGDFYTVLDDDCDAGDAVYANATTGAPTLTNTGIATPFKAGEKKLAGELVKITTNAI